MQSKNRLNELTSLKGIFILLIVLHNTHLLVSTFSFLPGMSFVDAYGGDLGNSIFFMLSGYLLTYSYRDRICSHSITFSDFLHKRLKKLYPLYFVTNVVAMIVAFLAYGVSALPITKTIFTLMLQQGGGLDAGSPYNSPTWFISALFVCYIAFYFISYLSKNDTAFNSAIAVVIVYGYTLMQKKLQLPFCFTGNGIALTNFFIGCSLAHIFPRLQKTKYNFLHYVCMASLSAAFYLMFQYGIETISGSFKAACAFYVSPLLIYLAVSNGLCSSFLRWKPLVLFGKYSIYIYFWHLVVLNIMLLVIPVSEFRIMHYLLYLVILMGCSYLSSLKFFRNNR